MISPYIRTLRAHVGSALLMLPSVSAHLFDDQRRLLLVRTADDGVWTTPGGFVEPDERPSDALVREVWEETGLLVEPLSVVGVFGGPSCRVAYPNGDQVQYTISAWRCRQVGGQLSGASDETSAAAFFHDAEVRALALAPWLREHLPLIFDKPDGQQYFESTWQPLSDADQGS